jgi:hypothetical protein
MADILYHGSPNLFDSFDLSRAGKGQYASNGGLGIWVTPLKAIATAFSEAGYLYELLASSEKVKKLPLRWLIDRHDEAAKVEHQRDREAAVALYDRIRCDLLAQGYTQIWIVEADGTALTRVVLDPDAIMIKSVSPFTKK